MKEAYWGYWLIVLGVFIVVVLLLVQNFTSTNSQDFYLVKEIAEAAMEDALDYGYYRTYGEAKINKEKFYESFIRRFSEEASLTTTYDIEFTEVFEAPPKIGVKVSSKSNTFSVFGDAESFDIVNKLDAIMETKVNQYIIGDSDVVEYRAGTAKDYADSYFIDYADANIRSCHDEKNYAIDVDYCGTFNEIGLKVSGAEDGLEYCVAHRKGDNTYIVVAKKSEFETNLCK